MYSSYPIIPFFYIGFLSRIFRNHGHQEKRKGISLTPIHYFHPLHRYLDISWAITAENPPLHIANSRTQIGSILFPSVSC